MVRIGECIRLLVAYDDGGLVLHSSISEHSIPRVKCIYGETDTIVLSSHTTGIVWGTTGRPLVPTAL
jgi:hypothetical protein